MLELEAGSLPDFRMGCEKEDTRHSGVAATFALPKGKDQP